MISAADPRLSMVDISSRAKKKGTDVKMDDNLGYAEAKRILPSVKWDAISARSIVEICIERDPDRPLRITLDESDYKDFPSAWIEVPTRLRDGRAIVTDGGDAFYGWFESVDGLSVARVNEMVTGVGMPDFACDCGDAIDYPWCEHMEGVERRSILIVNEVAQENAERTSPCSTDVPLPEIRIDEWLPACTKAKRSLMIGGVATRHRFQKGRRVCWAGLVAFETRLARVTRTNSDK